MNIAQIGDFDEQRIGVHFRKVNSTQISVKYFRNTIEIDRNNFSNTN